MLTKSAQNCNRLNKLNSLEKLKYRALQKSQEKWDWNARVLNSRYELGLSPEKSGPLSVLKNLVYQNVKGFGKRIYNGYDKYTTFKYSLNPSNFFNAIQQKTPNAQEPEVYAARWAKTFFFVLDIDHKSKYQQGEHWDSLESFLSGIGAKFLRCRSSYAPDPKHKFKRGIHLYVFLDKLYDPCIVRDTVSTLLKDNDFDVSPGQLEVYPTQGLLRLPLQEGFQIMNRTIDTPVKQIKDFLDFAAQNPFYFQKLIDQLSSTPAPVEESKPAPNLNPLKGLLFDGKGALIEQLEHADSFLSKGLDRYHSSHAAIFALSHYYWYILGPDDNSRFTQIMEDLKGLHKGFCKLVNRDQWSKLEDEVMACVSWRKGKHLAKPSDKIQALLDQGYTLEQLRAANNKRETTAQQKIYAAIEHLIKLGQEASVRAIHKLTKCSFATIQRHKQAVLDALGSGVTGQYVVTHSENLSLEPEKTNWNWVKTGKPNINEKTGIEPVLIGLDTLEQYRGELVAHWQRFNRITGISPA